MGDNSKGCPGMTIVIDVRVRHKVYPVGLAVGSRSLSLLRPFCRLGALDTAL